MIKQRREEDKEAKKALGEAGNEGGFTPKAAIPDVFKRGSITQKRNEEINFP